MVERELLKSVWEQQLAKEYDQLVWLFKLKNLRRPPIVIADVDSFWGQWDAIERRIKISKRLIVTYSWDIVINVLKHEMAHQLVSDFYDIDDVAHGNYFKLCCEAIGLPNEFRTSTLNLTEIMEARKDNNWGTESSPEVNILKRVEKLMSLAQSNNEHEAMAAMEKVFELFQKYNLERVGKKIEANYISVLINKKAQKISAVQSHITYILREFYFVEIIFGFLYDAADNRVYKTIEIFGTLENVKMAEYVYHFLENKIEDLWIDFSLIKKLSPKYKRSYLLGLLIGFKNKLKEIKEVKTSIRERSLVCVDQDEKLNEFISLKYPRLRKSRSSGSGIFGSIFEEGRTDGNKIILNKGLEKKPADLIKFLN
jgi:hypothetical protein